MVKGENKGVHWENDYSDATTTFLLPPQYYNDGSSLDFSACCYMPFMALLLELPRFGISDILSPQPAQPGAHDLSLVPRPAPTCCTGYRQAFLCISRLLLKVTSGRSRPFDCPPSLFSGIQGRNSIGDPSCTYDELSLSHHIPSSHLFCQNILPR